jgi:thiol-disulfide isomerase/thioredoxin
MNFIYRYIPVLSIRTVAPRRIRTLLVWALFCSVVWTVAAGGQSEHATPETSTRTNSSTAETGDSSGTPEASAEAAIAARDAEIQDILQGVGIRTFEQSIRAVDFGGDQPDGTALALADYAGSFVFLNFWATWCPPCREEMPSMETLHRELAAEPFTIVAVNVREERETVTSFLTEFGYSFPILLDPAGTIATGYGVRGLPTSYFISPEGRVLGMLVGTRYWDEPDVLTAMQEIARLAGGE